MGALASAPASARARDAPATARDVPSHRTSQLVIHPRHALGVAPRELSIIDRLPDDVVGLVLDRLSGADLARAECVSKRMRELARRDDDCRWRDALARDFGPTFAPVPDASVPTGAMKLEYVRVRETLRAIVTGRSARDGSVAPTPALGTRIFV